MGFQFVYQPLSGDGSITARVVSETKANSWVKAGVMFRETLAVGSSNAMLEVTPGSGAVMQSRTTPAGSDLLLRLHRLRCRRGRERLFDAGLESHSLAERGGSGLHSDGRPRGVPPR